MVCRPVRRWPAPERREGQLGVRRPWRGPRPTSGLSASFVQRLSGGASRLAALLLPQILPVSSVAHLRSPAPRELRRAVALAEAGHALPRGPRRGTRAGVVVRAPRSEIRCTTDTDGPLFHFIPDGLDVQPEPGWRSQDVAGVFRRNRLALGDLVGGLAGLLRRAHGRPGSRG